MQSVKSHTQARRQIYAIVAAVVACVITRDADAKENYFLQADVEYGTELIFNPMTVLLNVGFDLLRSGSYQEQLHRIDYRTGATNIFANLLHPLDNIETSGGAEHFISHEIFPYRHFNPEHGHFVPNWFTHVLGEGMVFRKLEEWYSHNDYSHPRLSAISTIFAGQFLNEIVENGAYSGSNNDPIADILIFNPIGWLLFSVDEIARFFGQTVKISFWPGQPSVNPYGLSLHNAAENYAFKIGLDAELEFSFFAYIGSEGLGGLSWRFNDEETLTVAGGYRVIWLHAEVSDNHRNMLPVRPGNWVGGLFWDRRDSLLFSALFGGSAEPTVRFNLYPGVLDFWGFHVGGFLRASPHDGVVFGVTVDSSPVGLAVGFADSPGRKIY